MPPNSVDYLNLEYILVRGYDFVAGFHAVYAGLPGWATHLGILIIVTGMFLSLLFLVLFVYSQIMLLQVEHAGFHALEAHAHEHHEPEVESTGRNERWERVVELASGPSEGDWRRAILEADIMLSEALSEAGYSGSNVGDQLKMANPIQVTTLDLAWKAHKMRNEVAHQGEAMALTERDVRSTIDYYKRVLEELGAI